MVLNEAFLHCPLSDHVLIGVRTPPKRELDKQFAGPMGRSIGLARAVEAERSWQCGGGGIEPWFGLGPRDRSS